MGLVHNEIYGLSQLLYVDAFARGGLITQVYAINSLKLATVRRYED